MKINNKDLLLKLKDMFNCDISDSSKVFETLNTLSPIFGFQEDERENYLEYGNLFTEDGMYNQILESNETIEKFKKLMKEKDLIPKQVTGY